MNEKCYDPAKLSFADLRMHYHTGRGYTVRSVSNRKTQRYRHGAMTNIGDIELSEWIRLVKAVIERHGEQELFKQLLRWAGDNCAWLHTRDEIEQYALKLHAARIFEELKWVDYERFRRHYMPAALLAKTPEHKNEMEERMD